MGFMHFWCWHKKCYHSVTMSKIVFTYLAYVLFFLCSAAGCDDSEQITCDEGQELCGSECVDVEINDSNCGACGVACENEGYCSAGTCNEGCGACTDDELCVQYFGGDCSASRAISCVLLPACEGGCSNNEACNVEACGGQTYNCMNGPTCGTPALPGVDIQCEGV